MFELNLDGSIAETPQFHSIDQDFVLDLLDEVPTCWSIIEDVWSVDVSSSSLSRKTKKKKVLILGH